MQVRSNAVMLASPTHQVVLIALAADPSGAPTTGQFSNAKNTQTHTTARIAQQPPCKSTPFYPHHLDFAEWLSNCFGSVHVASYTLTSRPRCCTCWHSNRFRLEISIGIPTRCQNSCRNAVRVIAPCCASKWHSLMHCSTLTDGDRADGRRPRRRDHHTQYCTYAESSAAGALIPNLLNVLPHSHCSTNCALVRFQLYTTCCQ